MTSFIAFVSNQMLQGQSNNVLRSTISKIMASINCINAHVNWIYDCIELRKVIFLSEGTFVCSNTDWTDFKVFIVDHFFEISEIEFLHKLLTFLLPKWSFEHFYLFFWKLLENLHTIKGIVLFGKLYCVRKETIKSSNQSHYYLSFGWYF